MTDRLTTDPAAIRREVKAGAVVNPDCLCERCSAAITRGSRRCLRCAQFR